MSYLLNLIDKYGLVYLLIQLTVTFLLYYLVKLNLISRNILMVYSTIVNVIYMVWRALFTIVLEGLFNMLFSLLLFFWEMVGSFQQVVFYITMWKPTKRKTPEFEGYYPTKDGEYPTVDFFVPTYNESLDILKRTLVACTYIDYPKEKLKIYALDDGARESVKQLATELGIEYIARPKHNHAKAGNLNYALARTNGELIATIDADMVPKSNFLKETVGFFQQRKMGFVQAPQAFFNSDPFQYNLSSYKQIPNEQDFFMLEMLAGKDRFNATMYIGSNAIFSRNALEAVGGFATGSITEDIATGMLIQAKGYRTAFVKKIIAKGLSAETFSELLKQRDRWARGSIQVFKKWNPLFLPGLTPIQRLLYFSGIFVYWFFGVQKLVYILSPILFLLFHIQSINATVYTILAIWLPKFLLDILTFRVLSANRRNVFWSHIYETAMAPQLALSVIRETLGIKSSKKFRVTEKGIISTKVHVEWGILLFNAVLFLLTIIGVVKVLVYDFNSQEVVSGYIINIFWAIYNMGGIILSMFISIEKPRLRKAERFPISIPCTLMMKQKSYKGYVRDISETGAKVQFELPVSYEENEVLLYIPAIDKNPFPTHMISSPMDDRFTTRLKWDDLPLKQYKRLLKFIFDQEENIDKGYKLEGNHSIYHTFFRSMKDKVTLLFSVGKIMKKQRIEEPSQTIREGKSVGM